MCKTAPGPRCGNHTHSRWQATNASAEKARLKVEACTDAVSENDTAANRRALVLARENYAIKSAKALEAYEEWNSTPEGQHRLERLVEAASNQGDEEKAQAYAEELNRAQQMRSQHMAAHRILTHSARIYDRMELNDRVRLEQATEELSEQGDELLSQAGVAEKAHREVLKAEKKMNADLKHVRSAAIPMRRAQQAVRDAAAAVYVAAGVDAQEAQHYAIDTAASMQSGWYYFSQDSADRTAMYGNNPTVKVKSGDHPDARATQNAAELLSRDENYQAAVTVAHETYATFKSSCDKLLESKTVHNDAQAKFFAVSDGLEQRTSDYRQKLSDHQHEVALKVSSLPEQNYHVNPSQFISSAYVNTDGSTNAYVLTTLSKKKMPCYVPISGRGDDDKGHYVLLSTGEKIYAPDITSGTRSLILTTPSDGAQKLFG